MKIVTSEVMRRIDELTISDGYVTGQTLMNRAGEESAQVIVSFLHDFHENFKKNITVICGKGNNGGDGYVIARKLFELGFSVKIFSLCAQEELSGDALYFAQKIPSEIAVCRFLDDVTFELGDVIIDCLLGTGLKADLRPVYISIIEKVNASPCLVVSIDTASGLNGTSGEIHGLAVLADLTIAIGLPKCGYFLSKGPAHTGRLRCVDIGFPRQVVDGFLSKFEMIDEKYIIRQFPRRAHGSHKYTCGNVLVLGGSKNYKGAVTLSARAAARSGAGMVTCAFPGLPPTCTMNSLILMSLEAAASGSLCEESLAEIRDLLKKNLTVVVGPGMLGGESERCILEEVFFSLKPVVVDAGGLMQLHHFEGVLKCRESPVVLTPHTGELRRVAESLNLLGEDEELAQELSLRLNAIVVLKGQFTRIYCPDKSVLINSSGCASLATAGSGDVLAGIIGAFISDCSDVKLAVAAAVYVHGLLGECTGNGLRGTVADDFVELLPSVLKSLSPFN
jgi:ADP-dependent NAD(P)H-hydrate dehydratase / NAD(P)H-hydrate epimerase